MAKSPAHRFASMPELVSVLEPYFGGSSRDVSYQIRPRAPATADDTVAQESPAVGPSAEFPEATLPLGSERPRDLSWPPPPSADHPRSPTVSTKTGLASLAEM